MASAVEGTYYLLDMGTEKYGDCVLCVLPDKTILIDGGHRSDWQGQRVVGPNRERRVCHANGCPEPADSNCERRGGKTSFAV